MYLDKLSYLYTYVLSPIKLEVNRVPGKLRTEQPISRVQIGLFLLSFSLISLFDSSWKPKYIMGFCQPNQKHIEHKCKYKKTELDIARICDLNVQMSDSYVITTNRIHHSLYRSSQWSLIQVGVEINTLLSRLFLHPTMEMVPCDLCSICAI